MIELNHAVAVGRAAGPSAGLALLDELDGRGELSRYHLLAAARAELLVFMGEHAAAGDTFRCAIEACANPVERAHLEGRLVEVVGGG
ncbi:MAG: hypothetical protein RQ745_05600 [Longimicrobiales bacterium]|nr:hypothetical protein [Longimicrobiales bacterium]